MKTKQVLDLSLKLLHITIFLAGTLSYDVPDFSTLMCATQWIYDCLQGSPSLFEGLNQKGEIIRNKYSLHKGHHIVDIWQALLPTKAADISVQRLTGRENVIYYSSGSVSLLYALQRVK